MIKRLLIANRGEIAVRIARACAEMGIRSVAIYSDADRNALHAKKADEAYRISADPLSGYLNPRKIVRYAAALQCDAIHPGYGFLSENPELAARCERAGIRFVGPSAKSIALLGDKLAARKLAREANANPLPGSDAGVANAEEAARVAAKVGYPVMLKAAGGGGGRGIRLCESARDIRRQFARVASEAQKAFGKSDIFVEKCVKNPRHIEAQIVGDSRGDIIHLYDRDCSIQRRNQKLIEIAPSPQLTDIQRQTLCERAVNVARAANYVNAGTVEFLMDDDGEFYFLEMNARLQVEHPVTEQITGVDIVQEQIAVACGERLSIIQAGVARRGFAMEFRINAEDPRNNFAPSFGRISKYYAPGGPGVRTDAAIYTGYEIPPYYDSMCAKLIVWALDWNGVLQRGRRALTDMTVAGVKTTVPYYSRILNHPDFIRAKFTTAFVANNPQLADFPPARPREDMALALAAALAAAGGARA